ncbi:YT521-B-like domain-containing protein [Trametes polyzona]|nr:YT521-B-like domain-containing protein [Trametes polyzona]
MSFSPVNTREGEPSQQYGQPPGSSPVAPMFPMSPTHQSGPSPGPSSPAGQVPYSPPPFSPSQAQYGHLIPDKSPPLPRGRPPEQGPATMSPASSSSRPAAERPPPARRPYHPNPPAHRSEWVMWTGNVPSDATHDELWRFFNSPPSPGSSSSVGPTSTQSAPAGPVGSTTTASTSSSDSLFGGVSSIFLISRSNCAFVNFHSEAHLQAAIRHFNGLPLRPNDPRCPRLVCRVRAREDDLKAGVGGQRGSGIHVRWVREKKEREREAARRQSTSSSERVTTPSSSPTDPAFMVAGLSLESDEEGGHRRFRKPEPHSSSSGSYASTNSSILTAYFPKRYFILKSLTQFDLDLSVEKGLWATQPHNEGILDQAYRTSKEVYLIFSVNKSGEFYGYAKMAGPIMRGEERVSWASRTDSPSHRRSSAQSSQRDSPPTGRRDPLYFSPSEQRYGESPFPMSPEAQSRPPPSASSRAAALEAIERDTLSAPAEMLQPHRNLSLGHEGHRGHPPSFSADANVVRPVAPLIAGRKQAATQPEEIHLDRTAPLRAVRNPQAPEAPRPREDGSLGTVAEVDERAHADEPSRGKGKGKEVEGEGEGAGTGAGEGEPAEAPARDEGPVWGEPFKVEWVRTDRLPFTRTRHLRNPWNHDREVKVSRDGTELEPSVGQALLDEWDKLEEAQAQAPATPAAVDVGRRMQGKASVSADALPGRATPGSSSRKGG